jgi:hypothetical protein
MSFVVLTPASSGRDQASLDDDWNWINRRERYQATVFHRLHNKQKRLDFSNEFIRTLEILAFSDFDSIYIVLAICRDLDLPIGVN